MKAAEIVQRVKLDEDNKALFKKKIAAGYYFCPRTNGEGIKHGNNFIKQDGHSYYCGYKDEKNIICFYHFHNDVTHK